MPSTAMVSTQASQDVPHRMSEQIDTEDENRRSRISLACTRCRTRKDRCDGLKPCTACRNAEKPCIYEATTKKRGLPEGYVRGLEKLFAVATQTIDGLEAALIKCLHDDVLKKSWNSTAAEELHSSYWKESSLHHELEILLHNTSSTTGTKRKREQEDDNVDDTSFILHNLKQLCYRVSQNNSGRVPTAIAAPISTGKDALLEPFPPNTPRLFDIYFNHVHCWFPILARPTVLKAYYESSRRTPVPSTDGNRALLWSILAYATMLDETATDKVQASDRFESLALNFLPVYDRGGRPRTEIQSDNLGSNILHAQAHLVLALLQLGRNCKLKSWTMAAAAKCILLANQEGVSSKPSHAALQGCELLTSYFHHEFGVNESIALGSAIDEDGHEEWETWGQSQGPSFSLSIFNKLCRILRVLSDKSRSSVEKSHEIRLVEAELSDAGIPPITQSGSPPHHIYLQLVLLHAKFALSAVGPSIERQELATQMFNLLDLCTSPNIGLEKVPPLLSTVFKLACNEANLASRQDLLERGNILSTELSNTWPCFRLHSHDRPTPQHQNVRENSLDALRSLTDNLTSQSQNQWVQTPPNQLSGGTPATQFDTNRSPNYSHGSIRNNSFGQINTWANLGNFAQGALPTVFPVPSPSFHGDEIDAIFHEMAHLDTNEWTNERALGLREFGFNDDSAFVEFCNDPERLALPAGTNSLPLSSNRQSWTFAAQPP